MFLTRIIGILLCLGIGATLILWISTGQSRYRTWAWNLFRTGVIVAFVILTLFALERILTTV